MVDAKRSNTPRSSAGQTSPTSGQAAAPDPATSSEVRTKLELARQFMDMGDPESARHMLDEVLKEGDGAQQQEAQQLLATLP